jgi:hypothetical protein
VRLCASAAFGGEYAFGPEDGTTKYGESTSYSCTRQLSGGSRPASCTMRAGTCTSIGRSSLNMAAPWDTTATMRGIDADPARMDGRADGSYTGVSGWGRWGRYGAARHG